MLITYEKRTDSHVASWTFRLDEVSEIFMVSVYGMTVEGSFAEAAKLESPLIDQGYQLVWSE